MRARHRSRGFATCDPASDALSPPRALAKGRLDPPVRNEVYSTSASDRPHAARRLLQPKSTCEHDYETIEPRTPRRGRPRTQRFPFVCGWRGVFRRFASRGRIGQGSNARGTRVPRADVLPPRSLATEGLPQPARRSDTSCRELVTTAAGVAVVVRHLRYWACYELAYVRACARTWIGPPLAPLREEGCDPPHPRCLPSPDEPF